MANPTAVSRHALAFIFIKMLVDTIGLVITIPVTPKLIVELTGGGMSEAARWGGWLFFVYALMQFLCAPAIGGTLAGIASATAGKHPGHWRCWASTISITAMALTILWLFIGRFPSGVAGAAYPTANAAIADVARLRLEKRGELRAGGRSSSASGLSSGRPSGVCWGNTGPDCHSMCRRASPLPMHCTGSLSRKNLFPGKVAASSNCGARTPLPVLVALRSPSAPRSCWARSASPVLMRLAHRRKPGLADSGPCPNFNGRPGSCRDIPRW